MLKDLSMRMYWKKRFVDDFELVSCDWKTSDTGEKKLQSKLNAILSEREYDCFDLDDSSFGGYADLSKKEDELTYTIVFIDKYTQIKYTVKCGLFAGEDVEFETENQSYISKWNTPEDPTEIDWDEDISYDLSDSWGSKYYEDAEIGNITDKTPPYSILSITAEACEGGKYSPDYFNNLTDEEKENHLEHLKIRVYSRTTGIVESIMDYYFYSLICWNRHTES